MTGHAWLRLVPIALTLLLLPASADAGPASPEVGFQSRQMPDGTAIGIWYPAEGTPKVDRLGPYEQDVIADAVPFEAGHPLVVMSHGSGGSFAGHYDTALALARAGFVVAALTHPGDNWQDQGRATNVQARPSALSGLIDFMLGMWPDHDVIDAARVGAFGFSAGGFTVLAAAGGRPDLSRMAGHCAAHPNSFECGLLRAHPQEVAPWRNGKDARIKAIVVAAPARGFTFDRAGLQAVDIPVQLWKAEDDQILPAPDYADAVRAALPQEPEFHTVVGAEHFDFLAPCATDAAGLSICSSAAGFDRVGFHRDFDAAVARFFLERL